MLFLLSSFQLKPINSLLVSLLVWSYLMFFPICCVCTWQQLHWLTVCIWLVFIHQLHHTVMKQIKKDEICHFMWNLPVKKAYLIFLTWHMCDLCYSIRPARRSRWHSGNSLASHLWGWRFKPWTLGGKLGSCLPMVASLQYRTLTNCMYWYPLPTKLPVIIWPVQCWKWRKTPNK